MFKNNKIVALVLCALMLFVPVAAMAMDAPKNPSDTAKDYLYEFWSKSTVATTDLDAAVQAYVKALEGKPWEGVTDADSAKKAKDDLAELVKAYEKELKKVNKAIAEAESAMNNAKRFNYEKMVDENGNVYSSKTKEDAKKNFEDAVKNLEDSKAARDKAVKAYQEQADFYKFVLEAIKINEKAAKAQSDLAVAQKAFEDAADFYIGIEGENEEQLRALAAPMVLKAWNNFAALATEYQKASVLDNLNKDYDDVKALITKGISKYEVMSTGEKGWILSDEAKNGCLKDVAEFKVEKKDGKFIAKVYGADGKEMKIGQQLTVYRPIAKDVKVLKAKVDGKEVTFAISTRGEQKYVSVPVVY